MVILGYPTSKFVSFTVCIPFAFVNPISLLAYAIIDLYWTSISLKGEGFYSCMIRRLYLIEDAAELVIDNRESKEEDYYFK